MKKLALTISWFSLSTLFLSVLTTTVYSRIVNPLPVSLAPNLSANTQSPLNATGSLIGQINGISSDVQTADARPVIIAEFLEKNNSPLKPYDYFGIFLTGIADKYNLDFRLLPSIMMQESNLCKKIPEGSFNCLGLGIHSKGTWEFDSYESNFEAAAKVLRENYVDKGLITPDQIQNKYTPGSNGSWEFAVNHFMDVLETAEF